MAGLLSDKIQQMDGEELLRFYRRLLSTKEQPTFSSCPGGQGNREALRQQLEALEDLMTRRGIDWRGGDQSPCQLGNKGVGKSAVA